MTVVEKIQRARDLLAQEDLEPVRYHVGWQDFAALLLEVGQGKLQRPEKADGEVRFLGVPVFVDPRMVRGVVPVPSADKVIALRGQPRGTMVG